MTAYHFFFFVFFWHSFLLCLENYLKVGQLETLYLVIKRKPPGMPTPKGNLVGDCSVAKRHHCSESYSVGATHPRSNAQRSSDVSHIPLRMTHCQVNAWSSTAHHDMRSCMSRTAPHTCDDIRHHTCETRAPELLSPTIFWAGVVGITLTSDFSTSHKKKIPGMPTPRIILSW